MKGIPATEKHKEKCTRCSKAVLGGQKAGRKIPIFNDGSVNLVNSEDMIIQPNSDDLYFGRTTWYLIILMH